MFSRSHLALSAIAPGAAFVLVGLASGCGSARPAADPSASSSSVPAGPAGLAIKDVQATMGDLTIGDGFVREPASPSVAAAYLTIVNDGDTDDRLVSVTSDVAGMVMPMTEVSEGGAGTMTGLDEVVVPAGGAFEFRPRAAHLMLEPLNTVPAAGDTVTLTLTFDRTGAVDVGLPVEPIGTAVDHGEDRTG
ncbi:copper chaperone PCu(A)C [Blastococcus capsensis]|uniref:copper chaperone PCu(A)C n=1 Tax=Blastococcus capsensis TaxID=1564163 RepID=UPI00253FC51F|nr:copper chaperone PCu(A)C [Blastococcus capsensis]